MEWVLGIVFILILSLLVWMEMNKQKKNGNRKHKRNNIIISGDLIIIKSEKFGGVFSPSHNGKYKICWSSRDGKYLLLCDNVILISGKLQIPNDGKVGDNGVFIFNDLMNNDSKNIEITNGTVFIGNENGGIVFNKLYKANLNYNYLTEDGNYALVQTYNSDNDDGNCLILIDCLSGIEIMKTTYHYGWCNQYVIDMNNKVIWQTTFNGNKYPIYIEQNNFSMEKYLLNLLEINYSAINFRRLGEYYESINENQKAIIAYEKALSFDSKVGVKKKLDALKKKFAALKSQ